MEMYTAGLVPGLYRHFRGGYYFVSDVDEKDSDNAPGRGGYPRVRYFSLVHQHWTSRSRKEFCELVKWPDNEMRPRFCPVMPSTVSAHVGQFSQYADALALQPNWVVEMPVRGEYKK